MAHILTMIGIQNGFIFEANPIQAFIQTFGWGTSLAMLSIFWIAVGLFYFKAIPRIYGYGKIHHVGQFLFAILLFSLLLIDFANDVTVINYLNNGGIII